MFALFLSIISVCSPVRAAGLDSLANVLTYNKILAIGESFHDRPDLLQEVHSFIGEASRQAEWIGIEVSSEFQGEIDAYLAGRTELPGDWTDGNRALLRRVREINRQRYQRLRVIALDLPVALGEAEGDWFMRRDPYMYGTLRTASSNFSQPGILLMGMGHIAKTPFRLPRIATSRMSLENQVNLTTLGTMLNHTPGLLGQVVTVAVHASGSWIERWSQLPPDYHALYKFMSELPAREVLDLNDERFHARERAQRKSFPIRLSTAFDYLINVPTKRTALQECQAALSAPPLLLRGALMNALDWYARLKK